MMPKNAPVHFMSSVKEEYSRMSMNAEISTNGR